MATNDNGHCPKCKCDLNGGSIYEHFLKDNTPEKALEIAEMYGATETVGRWGRQIGISSREKDRVVAWRCPDCDHEWSR